jgi:hypothetical protein
VRTKARDIGQLLQVAGICHADVARRFWAKVDKRGEHECWPWRTYKQRGYGRFSVCLTSRARGHKVQVFQAHRFAYWLTYGDSPLDLLIRHLCNNRACCNPKHLATGTHQDNMHDVVIAGSQRGERNPNSILTPEDVQRCRELRAEGWTLKRIGEHFGVHLATVHLAVKGKSWAHVADETTPAHAGSSRHESMESKLVAETSI